MVLKDKNAKLAEFLAFLFGMLMILIIFGDAVYFRGVQIGGNLDTIFGPTLWPLMDVVYPLASIAVFLLCGMTKGGLKFNVRNILLFLGFLAATVLIQFDDFFVVFHHTIIFPELYWTIARLVYFFAASSTFFAFSFAASHKVKNSHQEAIKTGKY